MDDVPIIDDLIVSPVRMVLAPGQRHQLCSSDKDPKAIIEQADTKPMSDQAGGNSVEDLAQGEAAGPRYGDDHLLEVAGSLVWKFLQLRAFGIDALAMISVVPADDLVDEGSIRAEIVEVSAATHQKGVTDGILEMAMAAFDRTVSCAMPLLLRVGVMR